jgi:predicted site-specific integrase-resolvase
MKLGLMTTKEVVTALCISECVLYKYIRRGMITPVKINLKQNGYRPEDIEEFLKKMQSGEFTNRKRNLKQQV